MFFSSSDSKNNSLMRAAFLADRYLLEKYISTNTAIPIINVALIRFKISKAFSAIKLVAAAAIKKPRCRDRRNKACKEWVGSMVRDFGRKKEEMR